VRFAFIDGEKAYYPVRMLCRLLAVSRAGFYAWKRSGPSAREREDVQLGVEVAAIYAEKRGRYGSPRVHDELHDRGRRVGRKRVARLMRERGLRARGGRRRRPRTTDSRHGLPVAPNLLAREFRVGEPNVAWVGDITYLPTGAGARGRERLGDARPGRSRSRGVHRRLLQPGAAPHHDRLAEPDRVRVPSRAQPAGARGLRPRTPAEGNEFPRRRIRKESSVNRVSTRSGQAHSWSLGNPLEARLILAVRWSQVVRISHASRRTDVEQSDGCITLSDPTSLRRWE